MRAKQEWERTFDAVPDLIAILDNDHRILRGNRAMAQALGEAPGPGGQIVLRTDASDHLSAGPLPHSRLLKDGQGHAAELRELDLDLLVTVSPLLDDQGRLLGSVHVARDITGAQAGRSSPATGSRRAGAPGGGAHRRAAADGGATARGSGRAPGGEGDLEIRAAAVLRGIGDAAGLPGAVDPRLPCALC